MSSRANLGDPFPELLAGWLHSNGGLIDALAVLRRSGQADAVEALLEFPALLHVRLSWELWQELSGESEEWGRDKVLQWVPEIVLEHCGFALCGRSSGRTDLVVCEPWP